jgi:predicted membrane GTPase involved in stress response
VYIEGTTGAHAIVCFNTTDKGIIFIEPQTDEIAQVVVGEYYRTSEIWVSLGVIKSYTIVW